MDNPASNTACHFGLHLLQGFGRIGLLARCERLLDGLDEGPDTADSRVIDHGALRVATDALLGLRRIRHCLPLAQ